MKLTTPRRRFSRRNSLLAAAALATSAAVPIAHGQAIWEGADDQGGDGVWLNANFSRSVGNSVDALFQTKDGLTSQNTTVTVGTGTSVFSRGLFVRNYVENTSKSITISLENGSTLTTGNAARSSGVINVGGLAGDPGVASSSTLTISGPATGTANFIGTRFYLEGNTANISGPGPHTHRNTLIVTGSGLAVHLDGTFSSVGNRSTAIFDGGVTVTTGPAAPTGTNSAGAFYVRAGKEGGIFDNRISVLDATISLHTVDAKGLFQLGSEGTLLATSKQPGADPAQPAELNITVGATEASTEGRFEAAGSGLDSIATVTVNRGTFAIGLSDPDTLTSDEAASFTLDQTFTFNTNSQLEFDIFGAGDADQLVIGENGSLAINGGGVIVLNLNGYTLEGNESWSLIDTTAANANWLTGSFNLSLIDTNLWDLSDFNAAGNWTIRAQAIPEPSTFALLGFTALAAAGWMKRRRSA